MTREDLRWENASLHYRIQQVLEMHPELREVVEAIALSQDLQVEVGAAFLERTQRKLQDRARAIIEHCPELRSYFDDTDVTDTPAEPTLRERRLRAALDANIALRMRAECLISAYIAPESDRPAIINELVTLFDGPAQREAERLTREALRDG